MRRNDDIKQNLRTIEKLERFAKAQVELLEEWGDLNDIESINFYPFKKCFMELGTEVSIWVGENVSELKEINNRLEEEQSKLNEESKKRLQDPNYRFQLAFLDNSGIPVSSQLAKSEDYIMRVWEDYKTMTTAEATKNFGGESAIKSMILGNRISDRVIAAYKFED